MGIKKIWDGTQWLKNGESTASSVRYDEQQSLSSSQKEQARSNIDAVGKEDYASNDSAGVIKVAEGLGGYVHNGIIATATRSLQQYQDGANMTLVGKGTLENIKDDLVSRTPTHSLAAQANKAMGLQNYSTLVSTLNAASSTQYNVGQSIYIQTMEVPDVWIYSVENTSVTYTYIDDATLVAALALGAVQIGYYKISMLETQKVDLTNYVTNTTYPSYSQAGVIKAYASSYGVGITNDGYLTGVERTYSQYGSLGDQGFVAKGTLENVLDNETIRTDKSQTLSSAQKTQVYNNLDAEACGEVDLVTSITGASTNQQVPSAKAVSDYFDKKYELINTITCDGTQSQINITADSNGKPFELNSATTEILVPAEFTPVIDGFFRFKYNEETVAWQYYIGIGQSNRLYLRHEVYKLGGHYAGLVSVSGSRLELYPPASCIQPSEAFFSKNTQDYPYINCANITCALPNGTIINLYGQRR